jgi:hypothetical protein
MFQIFNNQKFLSHYNIKPFFNNVRKVNPKDISKFTKDEKVLNDLIKTIKGKCINCLQYTTKNQIFLYIYDEPNCVGYIPKEGNCICKYCHS